MRDGFDAIRGCFIEGVRKMIIPTNKLQAVIHLQGYIGALDELIDIIARDKLTETYQILGAIADISNEIGELLEGAQYAIDADLDNLTGEQ